MKQISLKFVPEGPVIDNMSVMDPVPGLSQISDKLTIKWLHEW